MRGRRLLVGVGALVAGRTPARAGTTPASDTPTPTHGEDPRSCGDDVVCGELETAGKGGPPLVRGRQRLRVDGFAVAGRTPARAGTTRVVGVSVMWFPEDPRSCGDDTRWEGEPIDLVGGPPLVRGRRRPDAQRAHPLGRTPARAGTTHDPGADRVCREEDPRSCGDDNPKAIAGEDLTGGPPLVRGRQDVCGLPPGEIRRTPARAGTTRPRLISRRR